MAPETGEFRVPIQVAKTLTQLTDEPRMEVALRLVVKDALEHRLEKVQKSIKKFQDKYNTSFPTFKKHWSAGKITDRYSYNVEKDFWEWEGLTSRLNALRRLKKWL